MISIIVPVYNQEIYISRCIRSILNQTFSDFELLIINDGSTDSSLSYIYQFNDKRIRVFDQSNKGVSSARNLGLFYSKGEWVCFIDPDDYVSDSLLYNLNKFALFDRSDIIISDFMSFNSCEQHNSFNSFQFFPTEFVARSFSDKKDLFIQLMDGNYLNSECAPTAVGVPWAKLYRRDMLNSNSIRFNVSLPRMQDNLFNMEAFFLSESVSYHHYSGYYYQNDSLSSRASRHFIQGSFHPAIDYRLNLFKMFNLSSDLILNSYRIREASSLYFQEVGSLIDSYLPDVFAAYRNGKKRLFSLSSRLHALSSDPNCPKTIKGKIFISQNSYFFYFSFHLIKVFNVHRKREEC